MPVNTLDKYYTPEWLVKHTVAKTLEVIGKENITDMIEPSAGDGAFIEELDRVASELGIEVTYYDLYPSHPRVIKQDYKLLKKSYKKGRLVIGNPPYGTSSSLWKAFCKKSAKIADYVAFISPGTQYNANYYFKEGQMVYSELFEHVTYRGDAEYGGKDTAVKTCLNIYKCFNREEDVDPRDELLERVINMNNHSNCVDDIKTTYDYYISGWTNGVIGKICDQKDYCVTIGFNILNDSYKDKILQFCNEFDSKYKSELRKTRGVPRITTPFFKDELKKHLWPTRDELLERSIEITCKLYPDKTQYDYFISQIGDAGIITKEPMCNCYCLKFNDASVRQLLEQNIHNIERYIKKHSSLNVMTGGSKSMTLPLAKEAIKTQLWPTREDLYQREVIFTTEEDPEKEYYICTFGCVGNVTKEKRYKYNICVKFNSQETRDRFESIKDTIIKEVVKSPNVSRKNDRGTREGGGGTNYCKRVFDDILMKLLWPTRDELLSSKIKIGSIEWRKQWYDKDKKEWMHSDAAVVVKGDHGKAGLYVKDEKDVIVTCIYGKLTDKIHSNFSWLIESDCVETKNKIKELVQSDKYETFRSEMMKKSYKLQFKDLQKFIFENFDMPMQELATHYGSDIKKPVIIERELYGKALF